MAGVWNDVGAFGLQRYEKKMVVANFSLSSVPFSLKMSYLCCAMIYYFSGTGNSLRVARHLAEVLDERLSSMTNPNPTDGEAIGLVFPVYAWGIPNVVEKFVGSFFKAGESCGEGTFLYAVMTCGDDVGYADHVLDAALRRACGRSLDAAFSVQMPNTYVCLPGFDVDSPELVEAKLAREGNRVREVAELVRERRSERHLVRGGSPWAKTYVLRPLFRRFLLTDKYFHADTSRCTSCGKCQKICPVGNILLIEGDQKQTLSEKGSEPRGVPLWQSHCVGCLACYHACPHHAINFGCMTQKKGQYDLKI